LVITDNLGFVLAENWSATSTCHYDTGNTIGPTMGQHYSMIRTRYQDGTWKYNDGGLPESATS
jgi:hypothetical protein